MLEAYVKHGFRLPCISVFRMLNCAGQGVNRSSSVFPLYLQ